MYACPPHLGWPVGLGAQALLYQYRSRQSGRQLHHRQLRSDKAAKPQQGATAELVMTKPSWPPHKSLRCEVT